MTDLNFNWKEDYRKKLCSPQEAVQAVKDGDTVYIGTSISLCRDLSDALYARKDELRDITIVSSTSGWPLPFFYEEPGGPFSLLTYFAGAGERESMRRGNCRYTSMHLSGMRQWCRDFLHGCVAFISVSPPDENGYMSYGANGTTMHDDVKEEAAYVILEVNSNQPYIYGEKTLIHVSEADCLVETDKALQEMPDMPFDDTLRSISDQIVELIPDGATFQLGMGGISEAIGRALRNKSDLGVHSEMFSNSMMELTKLGVITNRKKTYLRGKSVCTFLFGSKELYQFADYNKDLYFAPYRSVNTPEVVAKNDNMISINTAMSVDLFGQVAADNIGGREQSGVGGQVDFVRGAQMSKGGKSFIALASTFTNKNGRQSKITAAFPRGTAITTSRQDVQYVVTEFGCVNLQRLSMQDRARALISLAHPDFRETLRDEARDLGLL